MKILKAGPVITAILLLAGIWIVDTLRLRTEDQEYIYHRFQKSFSEVDNELDSRGERVLKEIDRQKKKLPEGQSLRAGDDFRNPDAFHYLFFKDSLMDYNSNRILIEPGLLHSGQNGNQVMLLANGWFAVNVQRSGSFTLVTAFLIKDQYPIQNEWLQNHFHERSGIPSWVHPTNDSTVYPVKNTSGNTVFYLKIPESKDDPHCFYTENEALPLTEMILLVGLSLLVISISVSIRRYTADISFLKKHPWLILPLSAILLALFRWVQYNAGFPESLYHTPLFSPALYSSSAFLPSLGDFFLNALVILLLAWQMSNLPMGWRMTNTRMQRSLDTILLLLAWGMLALGGYMVDNLIQNSTFRLDFRNIASLRYASYYGFAIVAMLCAFMVILTYTCLKNAFRGPTGNGWFYTAWLVAGVISVTIVVITGSEALASILLLPGLYLLLHRIMFKPESENPTGLFVMGVVLFFAGYISVLLNQANARKDNERLELLSLKLATRQNPVTEERLDQMVTLLEHDTIVRRLLDNDDETELNNQLDRYLKDSFFTGYWRKYNLQFTLCRPGKELMIQPQGYHTGCDAYFAEMTGNFGIPTVNPALAFIDFGLGREYYLARLKLQQGHTVRDSVTLYIEFMRNGFASDPGYPGLLMDSDNSRFTGDIGYSYAIYQQGRLEYSAGSATYPMFLSAWFGDTTTVSKFVINGFDHYKYRVDNRNTLIISKNSVSLLTRVTPFSWLVILFASIGLLAAGYRIWITGYRKSEPDLRTKLQISTIGILIVTMLVIGLVQVFYIININEKKNFDYLREKGNSILTEVQHKHSGARNIQEINEMNPDNFLIKLSNVFFTDINFFDSSGSLIASSRREIFTQGLMAEKMDPVALEQMTINKNSLFIQNEKIGSMTFGSAYLPMYNEQGRFLYFINLPYFARQDDLKREISDFLVTFGNIYILIFLIGIVVSYLISGYITSPLALLSSKMGMIRLGKSNEKIAWQQNDEIGRLVKVYNDMVENLEKSAEQMARSEREGAWREMARQVAHEIKNPLTPMKLSAQYLQRAWNDKAPDMDHRIQKFTQTLVDQIDTLAKIASDFSDFARMADPVPEDLDLAELSREIISWYPAGSTIRYELQTTREKICLNADRIRMTRVLTNLVNNSIQAIGSRNNGLIIIKLDDDPSGITIEVSDNGDGIPPEKVEKIFQPDFTTKSGGMGLGLSIVKGIIGELNGMITFTSEEGRGTVFSIKIPQNQIF